MPNQVLWAFDRALLIRIIPGHPVQRWSSKAWEPGSTRVRWPRVRSLYGAGVRNVGAVIATRALAGRVRRLYDARVERGTLMDTRAGPREVWALYDAGGRSVGSQVAPLFCDQSVAHTRRISMYRQRSVNTISTKPISMAHAGNAPRMNQRMLEGLRWVAPLAVILLLSIGCASSRSGGDSGPGTVHITMGDDGAEATSSQLTLDALRSGQSVYVIDGSDGTYTVELTEEQIADLISGSSVMTEAKGEAGSEQVRISVEKASKRDTGW